MYSVLLVDDEEVICKGLRSMLERIGYSEIGEIFTAFSVSDALDIVKEKRPDIVLTDIRMPVYTGLDLIRMVSVHAIETKFIVLSGYDDFEYVKEAFKLGVQDYLLKPASIDELKAVLEKVIASIQEEQKRKISQQSSKSQYMHAVLENKLNKIFSGGQQLEKGVAKLFDELGIDLKKPCLCIGIISPVFNSAEDGTNEKIFKDLDSIGRTLRSTDDIDLLYFFDYRNDIVLLFNTNQNVDYEKLSAFMKSISEEFKGSMDIKCFMSISSIENDPEKLPLCYEQARNALAYRIIYGPFEVIGYPLLKRKHGRITDTENQFRKLGKYIKNNQTVEVSNLIDEMFNREYIKDYDMESIKWLYKSTVRTIYDITGNGSFHTDIGSYDDISRFNDLSDLKIYLKAMIYDAIAHMKENSKEKSLVDIVKKYLNENYNKDVDMAMAANMVSMSYSYFSKVFKDETGMNYSDYLTKIRMEKAMELLNNPVARIQHIAVSVGYDNPKHFTRAFKNYFGVSPSEYRDSF